MKTKTIVDILTPIYKIHKQCAIHLVGLKNASKKDVFKYAYQNIVDLMKHTTLGLYVDKKYFNEAFSEYQMLKVNLDISHEVGAVSNGLFADFIPLLVDIERLLQSFTDEESNNSIKESSAATAESMQ